jgi:hypothetical protein
MAGLGMGLGPVFEKFDGPWIVAWLKIPANRKEFEWMACRYLRSPSVAVLICVRRSLC